MKKIFIIPILILTISCATNWSTTDKAFLGITYGAMAIDTLQTLKIVTNTAFVELNPIIAAIAGISPVLVPVYFVGVGVGYYLIADNLDPDHRKGFLAFVATGHLLAIINNIFLGVF